MYNPKKLWYFRNFVDECQILARIDKGHPAKASLYYAGGLTKPNILYSVLGPLRLLLKTKTTGQRKNTFDWEWIAELMSHSEDMMQDELMRRHLSDIVGVFEDLGLLGDGTEASCSGGGKISFDEYAIRLVSTYSSNALHFFSQS